MDMITAGTTMRLQTGPQSFLSVPAQLAFDSADPYAVRLLFPAEQEPVSWVFGRELLAVGLVGGCGEGEVHVAPADRDHLYVALADQSGNGVALLLVPTADVADFLGRTYRAVPLGSEGSRIDWDRCIRHLLDRESGQGSPTA
ncbi:SsgA family sporulation/cell division regulator [Kitasatospora sp. NPDC054939]